MREAEDLTHSLLGILVIHRATHVESLLSIILHCMALQLIGPGVSGVIDVRFYTVWFFLSHSPSAIIHSVLGIFVIFLHLSVILFHRGIGYVSEHTIMDQTLSPPPKADTLLGRHTPEQTPPGRYPLGRPLPGRHRPRQTFPFLRYYGIQSKSGGKHPTGMHTC